MGREATQYKQNQYILSKCFIEYDLHKFQIFFLLKVTFQNWRNKLRVIGQIDEVDIHIELLTFVIDLCI